MNPFRRTAIAAGIVAITIAAYPNLGVSGTQAQVASASSAPLDRNVPMMIRKLDSLDRLVAAGRVDAASLPAEVARLEKTFKVIKPSAHPSYQAAAQRMQQLRAQVQGNQQALGMSTADATAFLKDREAFYRNALPQVEFTRDGQLTAEAVDNYVKALRAMSAARDKDLPVVRRIVAASGKGKRLLNKLEKDMPAQVKRNTGHYEQRLKSNVNYQYTRLEKLAALDPAKNSYAFRNGDKRAADEAKFEKTAATLKQAARLESQLGGGTAYARASQQFDQWLQSWRGKYEVAKNSVKLPADIGNSKLRAVASDVLKTPRYGISGWEKLIVNADTRPGESIDHKRTRSGYQTIIRRWDEFQVTTIEEQNGKYVMYYNTLRKFSRAPRTTPVNRWILAKRLNGGEVPASVIK